MQIERIRPVENASDKNRIITVTGISGAGKDYLVKKASELEPELLGGKIAIFNFGSELLASIRQSLADADFITQDALKDMQLDDLDAYIQRTLDRLISLQPSLQMTHVVFKQRGSYVMNPQSELRTKALEYLFIESDPDQISQWRIENQDKRKREIELMDDINLHQTIARLGTYAMATRLGAGMVIVKNDPSFTDSIACEMVQECRDLLL